MRFLRQTLYTNVAIKKLTDEIAPRFKELPAGFTRVEFTGKRNVDKGNRAMIELIGNPYSEFETNEDLVELEGSGLRNFWQWEMDLLEQEEEYWEDLLRNLKITIDEQIAQQVEKEGADEARAAEITADVNGMHATQKTFMARGLFRVRDELERHQQQAKDRRYQKMFQQYAFPVGHATIAADEREQVADAIRNI